MGKTVRTDHKDEDFGEDFKLTDYNAKAERHRLAERATKKRKTDKWDRSEFSNTKDDN